MRLVTISSLALLACTLLAVATGTSSASPAGTTRAGEYRLVLGSTRTGETRAYSMLPNGSRLTPAVALSATGPLHEPRARAARRFRQWSHRRVQGPPLPERDLRLERGRYRAAPGRAREQEVEHRLGRALAERQKTGVHV